jgi:hypothetical protein
MQTQANTYLLFKSRTRKIVVSRDMRWERWHGLVGESLALLMDDIFLNNTGQAVEGAQ